MKDDDGDRDDASGGEKPKNKKVELILETARSTFLEQGFERTSMDLIAHEAGVSKATLYVYFKNKQDLLLSLVNEECKHLLPQFHDAGDFPLDDIEVALVKIARNYTKLFLADSGLAFHILMITTAKHFPKIAEVFMGAGPMKFQTDLTVFFDRAVKEGVLEIEDIPLAAKQFLSLVELDLPLNWALLMKPPSAEEYNRIIESGVKFFLNAYGASLKKC
jgi:TetR/AcrR family transcriptional regulator, mexJK operon transcriptional repressor